ncbi:glycosyltransferase [Rhodococcus sp. IEGM 1379]|uniref:glycosyltransferase n=1 Tax=Rhodococcus sp. IEGM 1379 TaxID=3047086 RepID=UPI0024B8308F|nr:glycosyltransferase [Rhodococcus sp. IEGM 1379]MDI9915073.1 glycosyltransferase [Rhodococcus sp. IEGM 1379]
MDRRHARLDETTREVVMVGRISAQKDPGFYASAARAARSNVRWTWVGDGDAVMRSDLEQAGVTVTGWLPNAQVRQHLARADLYLHSARWEGAPVTLLEAAAVGTPVLARGIAELEGLGFPLIEDCPDAAACAVDRFFADLDFREGVRKATSESVEIHSPLVQNRALEALYGNAR